MADYYANHAVRIDGLYSESATPLMLNSVPFAVESRIPYSSGTGSYQANKIYAARITSTTNLDLDAGTMTDPLGNALTFSVVKGMMVVNRDVATGQQLLITGDFITTVLESTGAGYIWVGPGGTFFMDNPVDGYTVAATTGDLIAITSVDSVAGADVYIWGN